MYKCYQQRVYLDTWHQFLSSEKRSFVSQTAATLPGPDTPPHNSRRRDLGRHWSGSTSPVVFSPRSSCGYVTGNIISIFQLIRQFENAVLN